MCRVQAIKKSQMPNYDNQSDGWNAAIANGWYDELEKPLAVPKIDAHFSVPTDRIENATADQHFWLETKLMKSLCVCENAFMLGDNWTI